MEKGRDKNRKFIQKIKDDLNSTKLFFGHPQFKGDGYVKIVPGPPRSIRELVLIKENVRMGLYSLIIHYLNQGDLQNAYLCCSFLTRFDKSHYNHFVWFGKINKALGKNPEAKSSFKEALRICEGDKNWPRESMKKYYCINQTRN